MKENTNKQDITGTLENWQWSNHYKGSLEGDIYGDTKGRFGDGSHIYTSTLVACDLTEDTGFVKTLNSYYKLGKKFQKVYVSEEIPSAGDIVTGAIDIKDFYDLF